MPLKIAEAPVSVFEDIAQLSAESNGLLSLVSSSNKVHFISLGCSRNLVDTEVMLGILLHAGYVVEERVEEADYIVVNTCGFLEEARQEGMDVLASVLSSKKESAKVVVAGCMVPSHGEEIREKLGIDLMLGPGSVDKILSLITKEEEGLKKTSRRSYLESGEVPRQISTPSHFAYLKIAEGCRKACSYCIIPKIKGPLQSKSIDQVLKEFKLLLSRGIKEIVLIAQDLGDYGKDWAHNESQLVPLLERLCSEVDERFWLRLLYLYPDEITEDLIALMKKERRICAYLDMPIQHVSDSVLKRMRRKTSKQEITTIYERLHQEIPSISIRTSLMVGFPGETEEDFEELCAFVQKYPFDHFGIFKYSREKDSHSHSLEGHLSEETKERRYQRLVGIQKCVIEERNRRHIERVLPVLVEGYHPESKMLLVGRHKGQCPDVDGHVVLNEFSKVTKLGRVYQVRIDDVVGYDLLGRVIGV